MKKRGKTTRSHKGPSEDTFSLSDPVHSRPLSQTVFLLVFFFLAAISVGPALLSFHLLPLVDTLQLQPKAPGIWWWLVCFQSGCTFRLTVQRFHFRLQMCKARGVLFFGGLCGPHFTHWLPFGLLWMPLVCPFQFSVQHCLLIVIFSISDLLTAVCRFHFLPFSAFFAPCSTGLLASGFSGIIDTKVCMITRT